MLKTQGLPPEHENKLLLKKNLIHFLLPYQENLTNWFLILIWNNCFINYSNNFSSLMPMKSILMQENKDKNKKIQILQNTITQVQSNSPQPYVVPIKLVDVNKLLKKPLVKDWDVGDCRPENAYKTAEEPQEQSYCNLKNDQNPAIETSGINIFTKANTFIDNSGITVSHVLECLRVILPGKFDFSRLIPNEKVTTLVIRYLKVDDNAISREMIKQNLKIIIDAAKTKEKKCKFTADHPYYEIDMFELENNLPKIFPANFSMKRVTNELLNCLCIVLKVDIFSDAHDILRGMIQKYSVEGQKLKESIVKTLTSCFTRPAVVERKEICNKNKNKVIKYVKKKSDVEGPNFEISEPKRKFSVQSDEEDNLNDDPPFEILERKKKIRRRIFGAKDDLKKDPSYEAPPEPKKKLKKKQLQIIRSKSEECIDLKIVVDFIEKSESTALEVLGDFKRLFYLCRALTESPKCRGPRLQTVKSALHFINDNNINSTNVHLFKIFNPELKNSLSKQFVHSKISYLYNCNKLKMQPVVRLCDVFAYRVEDLLFMRDHTNLHKPSDSVRTCSQKTCNSKYYSSEEVKNLTSESYKSFRKLIAKRSGKQLICGLKYSILQPGSVVFAKDFRLLHLGWMKGTVERMEQPRTYVIQLENGEKWWCAPEQLRPLPNSLSRDRRAIKPKLLLDL